MGDEKLLKEIGIRISTVRKSLKMTQEELAEKMDVSVQMISNLELGKKAVRPENIVKLCNVLNISADYMLRGVQTTADYTVFVDRYKKLSFKEQEVINKLLELLV